MRRLSDHKRQFMKLYDEGLSDGKIGQTLGFHKGTVCVYRRRMNLPANFRFGYDRIVFSEEEKEKIREMRSKGASITVIAEKFGVHITVMLRRCREMGIDTSNEAKAWIRRENDVISLWNYLEDHGPVTQREVIEKLSLSIEAIAEYMRNLPDIFERFKFAVGTGSGSRGGVKYGGYAIYGDLSVNVSGSVISLNDDPRLIDYIAERIPFKLETSHNVQVLVSQLKNQIGKYRAQEVVKRMGYVYSEDLKKTPKGRLMKFTDEQLMELYAKKLSDNQIAAILKVTTSAICTRRKRLELPALYGRGERSRATYYALDGLYQVEYKS